MRFFTARWLAVSLLWLTTTSVIAVAPDAHECGACHAQQVAQWQGSHHQLAMQAATPATVLADFSGEAQDEGLQARFFERQGGYWMALTEVGTAQKPAPTSEYQIRFTFGVSPLQQYLAPMADGRLQVLPFAWDTRSRDVGGQRWFTLFEGEARPPNSRLHWQQPLQNWNGMCADCHATAFVRAYDADADKFASHWQAPQVSCNACHQQQANHVEAVEAGTSTKPNVSVAQRWQRQPGAATASLVQPVDGSFMQGCAACHSLRTPLTSRFAPGDALADNFQLNLLQAPLYHPDGQIKEEVYVWGSFLQSKMFARGVTCNDCHNPHSLQLKVTGDGLCTQCHSEQVFAVGEHHGHPASSTGARCVSCHMPATTYMGVDDRRDHQFVIPRPHLAATFGVPNSCTGCHRDRSDRWAAAALARLHGKPAPMSAPRRASLRSLAGGSLSPQQLWSVWQDKGVSAIVRASVLAQQASLWGGSSPLSASHLGNMMVEAANAKGTDLLAPAVITASQHLPAGQRVPLLVPQLTHPMRTVRIASAQGLLGLPLPAGAQPAFANAFAELEIAQAQSAWRGEGRVNQALAAQQLGDMAQAERQYLASLDVDPYFAPAYVNLADLYRQQQRVADAQLLYTKAVALLPQAASIRHSFALHLVRQQRWSAALEQTSVGVQLPSADTALATVHVLLLDRLARTGEALSWLQERLEQPLEKTEDSPRSNFDDDHKPLIKLGVSLAQKINDEALATWFKTRL